MAKRAPGAGRPPAEGVLGWREWVGLPEFGVESVKAKLDTGARTSSLHAFDLETWREGRVERVRFKIHPEQRRATPEILVNATVIDWRDVKPSSGEPEHRPVVLTTVLVLGRALRVELTLTRRDAMGFRMLLGRQALRGRFLVDPGRSYLNGKRVKGSSRLLPPPQR